MALTQTQLADAVGAEGEEAARRIGAFRRRVARFPRGPAAPSAVRQPEGRMPDGGVGNGGAGTGGDTTAVGTSTGTSTGAGGRSGLGAGGTAPVTALAVGAA